MYPFFIDSFEKTQTRHPFRRQLSHVQHFMQNVTHLVFCNAYWLGYPTHLQSAVCQYQIVYFCTVRLRGMFPNRLKFGLQICWYGEWNLRRAVILGTYWCYRLLHRLSHPSHSYLCIYPTHTEHFRKSSAIHSKDLNVHEKIKGTKKTLRKVTVLSSRLWTTFNKTTSNTYSYLNTFPSKFVHIEKLNICFTKCDNYLFNFRLSFVLIMCNVIAIFCHFFNYGKYRFFS